jgi:hypothetical protein
MPATPPKAPRSPPRVPALNPNEAVRELLLLVAPEREWPMLAMLWAPAAAGCDPCKICGSCSRHSTVVPRSRTRN